VVTQQGPVDEKAGEFWVGNAFLMPKLGYNLSAYEPNRLFINLAGARFLDATFASPASIDSDSRSVVSADFDRDGSPDLLVGSVGGGPLRLFLNRFPKSVHRLRVELIGVQSNQQGIGAIIEARCGERRILRDHFPSNGFMGQSPPELILGLGDAMRVDALRVRWPSGITQEFQDLPVDCCITLTEGQSHYQSSPLMVDQNNQVDDSCEQK